MKRKPAEMESTKRPADESHYKNAKKGMSDDTYKSHCERGCVMMRGGGKGYGKK